MQQERGIIRREHQTFWNLNYLMLCEEFSSRLKQMAVDDKDKERAKVLHDSTANAYAEMREGVAIQAELQCTVGQMAP